MDELDALFLGIIQGLTEFLPVSSSGHLEIGRRLLGANELPSDNLLMTSILHFATALSTIVVFRKEILSLLKGVISQNSDDSKNYIIKIIIAIIPAGIIGFTLNDYIEILFTGNITLVGVMLIITGILLFLTKIIKPKNSNISKTDAVIIGLSQAFAILPGISRSGATICTSLFLGNSKSDSAKFSFLIVIPVIFGAILKDVFSGEIFNNQLDVSVLIIGFLSSFIFGLLACKLMLKIVNNNNLIYFSFYCFILGIISISLL